MSDNTPTQELVDCVFCQGSGLIPEQHDWATEWLACRDCEGKGKVPKSWVEALEASDE